jgi:hypothetical protein
LLAYPVLICFKFIVRYFRYCTWSRYILGSQKPGRLFRSGIAMCRSKSSSRLPEHVGTAIRRASHLVPGSNCLDQAACCYFILRALGLNPIVRIGVPPTLAGAFQAHAWVEIGGRIILGDIGDMDLYLKLPVAAARSFVSVSRLSGENSHRK